MPMIDRRLSVVLALVAACGWCAVASAQSSYVTGDSASITVDVLPLSAEVKLDGVPIGTAHELGARVLPVLPGDHVIEVSADGHLSSVVNVPSVPQWATRVQLQLVPDRRP